MNMKPNAPCNGCKPPKRNAECHTYCEPYLEYEKERNAQYEKDAVAKDIEAFLNRRERERKSDIITGKMTSRRRKKK